MHFLFGTGLGMLLLWIGISYVLHKFRTKKFPEKSTYKDYWD